MLLYTVRHYPVRRTKLLGYKTSMAFTACTDLAQPLDCWLHLEAFCLYSGRCTCESCSSELIREGFVSLIYENDSIMEGVTWQVVEGEPKDAKCHNNSRSVRYIRTRYEDLSFLTSKYEKYGGCIQKKHLTSFFFLFFQIELLVSGGCADVLVGYSRQTHCIR